jgi:hypothetical protein
VPRLFWGVVLLGGTGEVHEPGTRECRLSPTDPQSWNAYAYVRNSRLSLIDPLSAPSTTTKQASFSNSSPGTGGATGYVNFWELGQLNEWQGSFLNNKDFYLKLVSLPAFQQQLTLEVAKLAAYVGISLDEAARGACSAPGAGCRRSSRESAP